MEETKHAHTVTDQDLPFVIDPITKEVVSQGGSLVVPQHAKNSERFTFTVPDRYIEGHDMSEVNQAFVHFRNIGATGELSAGIYKVKDLAVVDDSVTLSWLVDDEATYYAGALIFSIHFICTDAAGNVVYDLPTLTYSKISVGETVWNSEEIVKKYPDIIAELDGRVSVLEARVPQSYLYNGLELPPLPQWDKAAYPYALVLVEEFYPGRTNASLYVFSSVNYFTSENNGNWCISTKVPHGSRFFAKGASIEALQPFDEDFKYSDGSDGGIAITRADWANFDVLNEAGGVYLAASEPVPVGGNSGGNSGDAVLYTEQTLTPEQQEQARANIGAAAAGASLQIVQLNTPLENEVTLTEAEGAALDAAVAAGMPFVLKFDVKDMFTGCVAVASFCAMDDAVMVVLPRFAIFTIGLVKYDGVWVCEMTSAIG